MMKNRTKNKYLRFVRVVAFGIGFVGAVPSAALPEEIIALVNERSNDFKRIMKASSQQQGQLVLERWADLLLRSRFTLGMEVSREEVLGYLKQQFPLRDAAEAKQKKGKRRTEFSKHAEEMIAALIKAFDGSFRGPLLELTFRCGERPYAFPFKVEDVQGDLDLIMHGITVPESREARRKESRCLHVTLNRNPAPSLLEWIGAFDAACPVPAEHAGSCLLDVAERIARVAGRETLRLSDAAFVRCPVDRKRANLRRLRMYQAKPAWYESKGYVLQRDPEQEAADQEKFRSYRLEALVKDFDALKKSEEVSAARRVLKKRAPQFLAEHKDATVANFMTWLWTEDCASYTTLDQLITDPKLGSEFSDLYPHFALFEKRL